MLALYKTKARKREPIKVFDDKREVCDLKTDRGAREYFCRRILMAARQRWKCAICGKHTAALSFDHQDGRGANGWHRDDRIVVDGKWFNAALCDPCNGRKGSKRYHWQNGLYVPVVREGR